jgi:hypothetical protein
MPVILALRRPRQEDHKFEVSIAYIVRPCLKKPTEQTKTWVTWQMREERGKDGRKTTAGRGSSKCGGNSQESGAAEYRKESLGKRAVCHKKGSEGPVGSHCGKFLVLPQLSNWGVTEKANRVPLSQDPARDSVHQGTAVRAAGPCLGTFGHCWASDSEWCL